MKLELSLETGGKAEAGLDRDALEADIQAEIEALKAQFDGSTSSRAVKPAPADAQGMDLVVQWAIDLVTNPAMAKAYVHTFVFAINEVSRIYKSKADPTGENPSLAVRVKVLGKQISLPMSVSALQELMTSNES